MVLWISLAQTAVFGTLSPLPEKGSLDVSSCYAYRSKLVKEKEIVGSPRETL
jgi:hypothetical protein